MYCCMGAVHRGGTPGQPPIANSKWAVSRVESGEGEGKREDGESLALSEGGRAMWICQDRSCRQPPQITRGQLCASALVI